GCLSSRLQAPTRHLSLSRDCAEVTPAAVPHIWNGPARNRRVLPNRAAPLASGTTSRGLVVRLRATSISPRPLSAGLIDRLYSATLAPSPAAGSGGCCPHCDCGILRAVCPRAVRPKDRHNARRRPAVLSFCSRPGFTPLERRARRRKANTWERL